MYRSPAIPMMLNSSPCSGSHTMRPLAPNKLSTLNSIAVPQLAHPIPRVAAIVPAVFNTVALPVLFPKRLVIFCCRVIY